MLFSNLHNMWWLIYSNCQEWSHFDTEWQFFQIVEDGNSCLPLHSWSPVSKVSEQMCLTILVLDYQTYHLSAHKTRLIRIDNKLKSRRDRELECWQWQQVSVYNISVHIQYLIDTNHGPIRYQFQLVFHALVIKIVLNERMVHRSSDCTMSRLLVAVLVN